MVRPKKERVVGVPSSLSYFKPGGIPLRQLEETLLTVDELESLRLCDLEQLSHEEAGRRMNVSRATLGRIVREARRKVADALVHAKALRVEGGNYRITEEMRLFVCSGCGKRWEEPYGTGRPDGCPSCDSVKFHRVWKEEAEFPESE
ncbi:DUF134 domain-containing protein [Desulfoluna spongiiphila]|uniref:UPF0251 protein SAMN05216233_102231 n=1 Tax=Desulfoluna spongiiphila TaxID=419481 RepID=A0A1G5BW52_9BACT|nr:DUF134 domain-containing protein [Desulfoluna spongiiphila]SCX94422.1 Predicted DNA-binding protein, UPF0251 family [Desulfoluna spongiiphila]